MLAEHLKIELLAEDSASTRDPDRSLANALAKQIMQVCPGAASADEAQALARAAILRATQAVRAELAKTIGICTDKIAAQSEKLARVHAALAKD